MKNLKSIALAFIALATITVSAQTKKIDATKVLSTGWQQKLPENTMGL